MRIRCEVTRFRTWPDLLCCMKASYSAYCHHHIPCPQAGISRPGARRPGDQLQEQLSYAGPGDWWAYCLSPVLPALAADQTLGGLTWEPIWPDGLGGVAQQTHGACQGQVRTWLGTSPGEFLGCVRPGRDRPQPGVRAASVE